MLFILVDRQKPDSFFKPYYDILPPSLRNMQIFWNEEEMKEVQDDHLIRDAKSRPSRIKLKYEKLINYIIYILN